ncbi:hypothetical protein RHMOL_Rhmol12G0109200 [Rhododendron molle]|uniref:Uncharacterized protein n=1 Tax=Rhododendron molle TaxID=49168 RepID=A0ACC0LGK8_RHOML|nr:hypothetical protein RHMOL_Rhmol12G0109200 [Rhododendron molle]
MKTIIAACRRLFETEHARPVSSISNTCSSAVAAAFSKVLLNCRHDLYRMPHNHLHRCLCPAVVPPRRRSAIMGIPIAVLNLLSFSVSVASSTVLLRSSRTIS